jgi:hypothetical protein
MTLILEGPDAPLTRPQATQEDMLSAANCVR